MNHEHRYSQVTVRFSPELVLEIRELATRLDRSVAWVIRNSVQQRLAEEKAKAPVAG